MSPELSNILRKLRQLLPLLSKTYKVESLGIFGSYVRQEQRDNSDLDILVTFSDVPSLLKYIELENYLSDTLRVRVDLVMKDALKPAIGEQILREVITV